MDVVDPFEGAESLEERAEVVERKKERAVRAQGREAAILRGQLLGEDEARRRGEIGQLREQRVARAMAYATWEYDGKPAGGVHLTEMGVGVHGLDGVVRGGADLKGKR